MESFTDAGGMVTENRPLSQSHCHKTVAALAADGNGYIENIQKLFLLINNRYLILTRLCFSSFQISCSI